MDKRFNKRVEKAAFRNSVVPLLFGIGVSIAFVFWDIYLRQVSDTNPTENFSREYKAIILGVVIFVILSIVIYGISFIIEKRNLFPDIKITRIPIDNIHLGNKGQICFWIDIKNEEIEKLTDFWGSLKTIVVRMSDGETRELIIDPDDAILVWDYYGYTKIELDGLGGHAKLKIVEEGSFQNEDALFARFMALTTKDTKLQLQELSSGKFIVDLYLEIELNGFWKEKEIHPRRYYYHISYQKDIGGISLENETIVTKDPRQSDVIFEELPQDIKRDFMKATKKADNELVYDPLTEKMFFRAERKINFTVN